MGQHRSMTRVAVVAALLLLTCAAKGELSLQALQEDNQPGESIETYAILENGKVVGMVQNYQASSSGLRHEMGRRAGPSDAVPTHASRLVDSVRVRMDIIGALHDQLQASRCPFARQMAALERMQAAAATNSHAELGDTMSRPGTVEAAYKLFGDSLLEVAAPLEGDLGQDAEPFPGMAGDGILHAMGNRGPHMMEGPQLGKHGPYMVLPRHHRSEGLEELDAMVAEHPTRFPHLMRFPHPMHVPGDQFADHPFAHQVMMMRGQEQGWAQLENTAMPAPGMEPDINWRFWSTDGSLDLGLVTFIILVVPCAAVWASMLVQYCAARYTAARPAHTCFITRAGCGAAALEPLLHEDYLYDGGASPKASLKDGVESAAVYVPAAQRNVTLLHYEPPKM